MIARSSTERPLSDDRSFSICWFNDRRSISWAAISACSVRCRITRSKAERKSIAETGDALLERIEISLNGSVNEAAQLIEARTDCAELLLTVGPDRQKLAAVLLRASLERRGSPSFEGELPTLSGARYGTRH